MINVHYNNLYSYRFSKNKELKYHRLYSPSNRIQLIIDRTLRNRKVSGVERYSIAERFMEKLINRGQYPPYKRDNVLRHYYQCTYPQLKELYE